MYFDLCKYEIIFSKTAEKFLNTLDQDIQQRILKKIRSMQLNEASLDIKKLRSKHVLYRLRVGNFRVIYALKHDRCVIYIVAIGLRKDIYKQSFFA